MALNDVNSEDRLVQRTFAEHTEKALGWENAYAWNAETLATSQDPSLAGSPWETIPMWIDAEAGALAAILCR
jgi:hypothetical protein